MTKDLLRISAKEIKTLRAAVWVALFVLALWCLINQQWPNLSRMDSVRTLLLACIFYPVCEEIIFRAFLLKETLKIKSLAAPIFSCNLFTTDIQITPANIIVSAIFATAHAWYFSSVGALAVFFPSIIFGMCFEIRGRVLPAIIIHGLYNLMGLMAPAFYWV
ncbi:JDVT-CTERM system glutamic-type intramembrane protease [Sessilibacter corallicola]|uniref:CAAX prenyl protease 2/Lysostaphin resistance protein A-like domain-containing protein n=1 Tax=Sessilibacter corallicola TaxID=2904075 RepID=A0ABQ0AEX1_9GAMM